MNESIFTVYATGVLVVLTAVVLRLIAVLPACHKKGYNTKSLPPSHPSLLILLGSGGHTGEMIRLLAQFKHLQKFARHYIVSSGDETSRLSIQNLEGEKVHYTVLPRARNIGEGKLLATVHTLQSFAATVAQLLTIRVYPDVFLCNGPGTAIPIAYTLFVLKFLGVCHTKIVYVESLARVKQLSLTGLLIMPVSDRILVQWPQLAHKYPRCEYYGMLV